MSEKSNTETPPTAGRGSHAVLSRRRSLPALAELRESLARFQSEERTAWKVVHTIEDRNIKLAMWRVGCALDGLLGCIDRASEEEPEGNNPTDQRP